MKQREICIHSNINIYIVKFNKKNHFKRIDYHRLQKDVSHLKRKWSLRKHILNSEIFFCGGGGVPVMGVITQFDFLWYWVLYCEFGSSTSYLFLPLKLMALCYVKIRKILIAFFIEDKIPGCNLTPPSPPKEKNRYFDHYHTF